MRRLLPVLGFAVAIAVLSTLRQDDDGDLLDTPVQAAPGVEVTLLSTTWCGYCDATRSYLKRNGVSFTEIDVENDPDGHRRYLALGSPGVPILVIDEETIVGIDVRAWVRALTRGENGSEPAS